MFWIDLSFLAASIYFIVLYISPSWYLAVGCANLVLSVSLCYFSVLTMITKKHRELTRNLRLTTSAFLCWFCTERKKLVYSSLISSVSKVAPLFVHRRTTRVLTILVALCAIDLAPPLTAHPLDSSIEEVPSHTPVPAPAPETDSESDPESNPKEDPKIDPRTESESESESEIVVIRKPQPKKPQPVEPQPEEPEEPEGSEEHEEEPEFEYMEPDKKIVKTQNKEIAEKNRNDFDLSDSTMEFLGSVDSEKKKVNEGTDDELDQLLKEMEDMDF